MEKQLFRIFFLGQNQENTYLPACRTSVADVKILWSSRCEHIYLSLIYNKSRESKMMKENLS